MQSRAIQHVSLWLDDASLNDAAFPHALEWALGLNVPLRVIATAADSHANGRVPVLERIRALGTACARKGASLETHLTMELTPSAVAQFCRPNGICVFSEPAASRTQRDLFHQASHHDEICQLVCPQVYAPVQRVLILCHQARISAAYLESAGRICQALETIPIVLILADTERDSEIKVGCAEGICGALRLEADIDSVIHGEFAQAIAQVVSWRGCSHVIVERENDPGWWDPVHRSLVGHFCDPATRVSMLAIPKAASFQVPHKSSTTRSVLPFHVAEVSERLLRTRNNLLDQHRGAR